MKLLRCPDCGATEDQLYAVQDATIDYRVRANPQAPDGIATFDENISGLKSWYLGCNACGEQGPEGDTWTADWWEEVDEGSTLP